MAPLLLHCTDDAPALAEISASHHHSGSLKEKDRQLFGECCVDALSPFNVGYIGTAILAVPLRKH